MRRRTVTREFRRGVRFHDGESFNAAAVKYNIEYAFDCCGTVIAKVDC